MEARFWVGIAITAAAAPASGWAEVPAASALQKPAGAMNPDVSVNLLGLLTKDVQGTSDRGLPGLHNGLNFQEAELQIFADVDPYLKASALLSLAPSDTAAGQFKFEPEEVFFETLSLPYVTLRAGKFKAALGRHNELHTHAFPFIDAPLISKDLLGDEGLADLGLSASLLLPMPWFSEVTAQGLGAGNAVLFNSPSTTDLAGVGQLRNLWEIGDSTTFEWRLFGTAGANAYASTTTVYGTDLILKWRPTQGGKYSALIFQAELLSGGVSGSPAASQLAGLSSWVQWQFAERWWLQGREELEGPTAFLPSKNKQSLLLGFFPSEFSGFRVQLDRLAAGGAPVDYAATLQYNITIGAHPAHAY